MTNRTGSERRGGSGRARRGAAPLPSSVRAFAATAGRVVEQGPRRGGVEPCRACLRVVGRACVDAQGQPQLALTLGHALADGRGELAQAVTEVREPVGDTGRRVGLRRLADLAHRVDTGGRAQPEPEESCHGDQPLRRRRPPVDLVPAPLRADRTPYVKAATLTTGLPSVAAKRAVRALAFVVMAETLVVMPSTRASCSLVRLTVSVSLIRVGWTFSVVVRRPIRVSSRILPALPITLPSLKTRNANARAAIIPAMSPRLTSMSATLPGCRGRTRPVRQDLRMRPLSQVQRGRGAPRTRGRWAGSSRSGPAGPRAGSPAARRRRARSGRRRSRPRGRAGRRRRTRCHAGGAAPLPLARPARPRSPR